VLSDLQELSVIGSGSSGVVKKVLHRPTQQVWPALLPPAARSIVTLCWQDWYDARVVFTLVAAHTAAHSVALHTAAVAVSRARRRCHNTLLAAPFR
jgi:hypothetical protein